MSNVFAFDSLVRSLGKKPERKTNKYPTVPESDWPALDVIQPNAKDGPWIAGGACLKWYQGQPVNMSDIDVFFRDAFQLRRAMNRIEDTKRFHVRHRSENAITYEYSAINDSLEDVQTVFTIQLIQHKYFNSMEEVIDRFDFSVCQVATCGEEWVLGEYTARDIRSRSLRAVGDVKGDIAKRLTKYWVYGYRPVEGLVNDIISNPNTRYKFSQDEDYNNVFQ
jgi:hypothetical protein